jgi:hypothetical protein
MKDVDEVTVLVEGPPQVSTPALDVDDYLVEEPSVTARPLAFLDAPRVLGPERSTPLTNGLVGQCDATLG